MNRERCADALMNGVNVLIILVIVLLYVVTGTGIGDDAIAALSSGTRASRRAATFPWSSCRRTAEMWP